MKKHTKRILSMLLAAVLLFGGLSVTSMAADDGITTPGGSTTAATPGTTTRAGSLIAPFAAIGSTMDIGTESGVDLNNTANGTGWSWNGVDTLTLNSTYTREPIEINCDSDDTIKLVYNGNVTVTNNSGNGIYCHGSLIINGSGGTLTSIADLNGILVQNGDITINSGTIKIDAVANGILVENAVTISDGSLEITAGDRGINSNNGNVAISGGALIINADDKGINAANDIAISGSVITIVSNQEVGIYAENDVTISGGSGTVKSLEPSGNYWAVTAFGTLTTTGVIVKGRGVSGYTVDSVIDSNTFVDADTNDPLTNIWFGKPNVTYTATGSINMSNPTDLVLQADDFTPLAGYAFEGMRIVNATGQGYNLYISDGVIFDPAIGTVTLPAAMFGQHGGRPLSPGIYTAMIAFNDGAGGVWEYSSDVSLTSSSVIDPATDAEFTFSGNYAELDKIFLNNKELGQTPTSQTSADLSGYPGYTPVLGGAEAGSVKVTLYKAFLATLPNGTYTLTVQFKNGTFGNLTFDIQQQTNPNPPSYSNSGSSSGGRSKTITAPAVTWLERDPAAALAKGAKSRGEDYVRTRITGIYGVRGNAWDSFSGLRYAHDTVDIGAVQVRVYIDNPEKLTKDTRVSGHVNGPDVDYIKSRFEKWFNNKLRAIYFDHQGDWGQPVEISAKLDLTGMDAKNLYFYSYDKATNSYKLIEKPAYWIDKNGYLHFTTESAGEIIVSGGLLVKK